MIVIGFLVGIGAGYVVGREVNARHHFRQGAIAARQLFLENPASLSVVRASMPGGVVVDESALGEAFTEVENGTR